jgi:dUTPase
MNGEIIFRKMHADARVDDEYYNIFSIDWHKIRRFVRTGFGLESCPDNIRLTLLPREGRDMVIDPDYFGEICVRIENESCSDLPIADREMIGQIKINKKI